MSDRSHTIWVVEDDAGIMEVVTLILESEGYRVRGIDSEYELKDALAQGFPDLILLDILLSGVDGRDICARLKSDPKTEKIKVIIMSADMNLEQKAMVARADGFIRKPFDTDELLQSVQRYLAD